MLVSRLNSFDERGLTGPKHFFEDNNLLDMSTPPPPSPEMGSGARRRELRRGAILHRCSVVQAPWRHGHPPMEVPQPKGAETDMVRTEPSWGQSLSRSSLITLTWLLLAVYLARLIKLTSSIEGGIIIFLTAGHTQAQMGRWTPVPPPVICVARKLLEIRCTMKT